MSAELREKPVWKRVRLEIYGVVQGVGFRPFVYAAAKKFNLKGFVGNASGGVFIEVEGEANNLRDFQNFLNLNYSLLAHITAIHANEIAPQFPTNFYIAKSENRAGENPLVSPARSEVFWFIETF